MPIKDLKEKKCLITGAASGIGRATAIRCAREGAQLVLTDINKTGLENCRRECEELGAVMIDARVMDISDQQAVFAWAAELHANVGALDVLMNIAGISTWGTLKTLKSEHWQQLIDINLLGPVYILEAFVPTMMDTGRGGHIVNVSSAAGLLALPWHAAYSATKFGLRGISEVLRFDLEHYDIGVSLVCPGAVDTGLVNTVNIVGLDRENPEIKALVTRFQRHAVTPDKAAAAILKGIRKNTFYVYTSWDIRLGHWAQRCFPAPYRWVMRRLNKKVHQLAVKQGVD